MDHKPDAAIFLLFIVLFWCLILRLIIFSETNHKGMRKFLSKYRLKNEINKFQRITALYLLKREINLSYLMRVTIVVFLSGVLLFSSFFVLIMFNLIVSIPAILVHFQEITIWFNYLSIVLIFLIQIFSRLLKRK